MDSFFIEFRDPLFSVIILFSIIFVISFFSYWWGRYRAKDNYRYLDRFLEQFHTLPTEEDIKTLIRQGDLSYKSWLLLADAYTKNGDYEKAIDIYSEVLRLEEAKKSLRDIMFLLGKTYFKAGFLGRSRDVFLEILKKNPRTPQALHYLLLVYEYMRDYNAALEVLEPLDILGEDIAKEKLYLRVLALLQSDIDEDLRKIEITALYKEHKQLERMIFEYLFRIDPKTAWKYLDLQKAPLIADILWQLDQKDLSLDIISKSNFLEELYTAKGYIDRAKSSKIFELDLLIKLPKEANATIGFEYLCQNCKVVFPFGFHRCSSCHKIDTATLEYSLIQDYQKGMCETGDSFL
ncbi:FIG00638667: hypothetical protein [hydrothermal vent metagenome]|uniref:Uncharacterized protein n=1 Tax=hydrothermal vent metagenome TaxID=652676 RepID=A0A1W1BFD4_9ZZZZ